MGWDSFWGKNTRTQLQLLYWQEPGWAHGSGRGLRSPLRVGCLHPVSCSPDVRGRDSGERAFPVDGHEVKLLWMRFALTKALVRQMTWWRFAGLLAALSAVGRAHGSSHGLHAEGPARRGTQCVGVSVFLFESVSRCL